MNLLKIMCWLAAPSHLHIFYSLRVRAKEKTMLDTFGEQYHAYMQKTGAIFPKFT
jgi:protein-S-isoprenylcysteine O-methyltransferase Ste14